MTRQERYKPFGETLWSAGTNTPTTQAYTGQKRESSFGLYDYNARWYDSAIGRFTQADTIVPNAASTKAFDRYACACDAYVENNPIRYNDPSGHFLNVGIGAVVGFVGDYAFQTYRNMQDKNMNFSDAVSWDNINKSELIGATVAGTVAGATFGAGLALGGAVFGAETLGATVVAGAVSSVAAGQAGALTNGLSTEITNEDSYISEFNISEGIETAKQSGFLDKNKMVSDAVLGGASAGVGKLLFQEIVNPIINGVAGVDKAGKIIPVIDGYIPRHSIRGYALGYPNLKNSENLAFAKSWQSFSSTFIQPVVEDIVNRSLSYIDENY